MWSNKGKRPHKNLSIGDKVKIIRKVEESVKKRIRLSRNYFWWLSPNRWTVLKSSSDSDILIIMAKKDSAESSSDEESVSKHVEQWYIGNSK